VPCRKDSLPSKDSLLHQECKRREGKATSSTSLLLLSIATMISMMRRPVSIKLVILSRS